MRVNIRPGVSILSVLRHLNYTYWFALAEFVDNALQSYLSNLSEIERLEGRKPQPLTVSIMIEEADGGRLTIRDDACGIAQSDFPRAFRPAEIPPDSTGLSEFGMGMKSAACWCGKKWRITTKHFSDAQESRIEFDVPEIIDKGIEFLEVKTRNVSNSSHYTEIVIEELHKIPRAGALGRIREHLGDIYRVYLRNKTLKIKFGETFLFYDEPEILRAPHYRTPNGPPLTWKKEVNFDFGDDLKVTGFAALRAKGDTANSGFSLFRRGRLIEGSGSEPYRPESIFGRSNSYASQRLFGELHLDGFAVSHTKDGFQWDDNEEPFLQLLQEQINQDDLPLLKQAENYRARSVSKGIKPSAEVANSGVATSVQTEVPAAMQQLKEDPVDDQFPTQPPPQIQVDELLSRKSVTVTTQSVTWNVTLDLTNEPLGDWCEIALPVPIGGGDTSRQLHIRMSLANPFVVQFSGANYENLEALWRISAALGIAETIAFETGGRPAAVRRNMNDLLRNALSKRAQ
jgi:hypothetical protein